MFDLIKDSAIFGIGTLASAALLQTSYEKTGFYPPKAVFWFFTGFGGYLAVEAVEHLIGRELIEASGSKHRIS